jgi:hypothetical protein
MRAKFLVVILFFVANNIFAQNNISIFKQGLRVAVYTNDLVNNNYKDQYYSLNSNGSLCYELGYVLRTNTKLFLESGINTGLNTIVYTTTFNDLANNFDSKYKIRSFDIFYTKFPISLGYNANLYNLPFQFKAGINFAFMKPGSIRTNIYNTTLAGVRTHYFANEFEINYKEYVYKSASASVGHYINIFKKSTLLMELNLTYFPDAIGDYYFEAYPDDPRYVLIRGKLEDNWNLGINLTYLL